MDSSSITKHQKNLGAILHISTFSKYFFPFGNFIAPLVLWISNKESSPFIDEHGKQAINFQISILLYSLTLGLLAIPFFFFLAWDFVGFVDIMDHNKHHVHFDPDDVDGFLPTILYLAIFGVITLGLFILDIYCTITAALKASNGEIYQYPFTIRFIK